MVSGCGLSFGRSAANLLVLLRCDKEQRVASVHYMCVALFAVAVPFLWSFSFCFRLSLLVLQESSKLVASISDSPKPPPKRVTLTYKALHASKQVCFVAAGGSKADVLPQAVQGQLPAGTSAGTLDFGGDWRWLGFIVTATLHLRLIACLYSSSTL